MSGKVLSDDIKEDIKRIGISVFKGWLDENKFELPGKRNFFESLEEGLKDGKISFTDINSALCELEENSDKKIHLYQSNKIKELKANKAKALRHLKLVHGRTPVQNYSVRVKPRETSTFNYLSWEDDIIKLKFSERHYDADVDYETGRVEKTPKNVYIIIVIDLNDGIVQIRYDNPGKIHRHKNDKGKPSEIAYEKYYEEILFKLFDDIDYVDLNLIKVSNKILNDKTIPFKIHRGVNTITNGGKQVFSFPVDDDIRDIPEYKAASTYSEDWLTDDLSGFWKAIESEDQLNKDLFMRISRKNSEIRVQRGCLEKELNYGIAKIKEIQQGI